MEDTKYTLSGSINLAVPAQHADRLISMGDGTCALLYLYALRENASFTAEGAAKALCRTPAEISAAAEKLRSSGLFSAEKKAFAPRPAEELPQYPVGEIIKTAKTESAFQAVIDEAQHIFGKILTGPEINTLYGLYSDLALPPEVIILLINHCVGFTREKFGPGKMPSMRTVEKEGYAWFNAEIVTLDRCEEHLRRLSERRDKSSRIKRVLQINDRGFTASEASYVDDWLKMGFDTEAIAEAYDRTVMKTGRLQWKYMDSILKSWNDKGLHTPEEIEKGDQRGAKALYSGPVCGTARAAGTDSRSETERIREMMEKL
jgi:DnaD/phage-associated family protein